MRNNAAKKGSRYKLSPGTIPANETLPPMAVQLAFGGVGFDLRIGPLRVEAPSILTQISALRRFEGHIALHHHQTDPFARPGVRDSDVPFFPAFILIAAFVGDHALQFVEASAYFV